MKALSRGISFVTVALLLIAGSASATLVVVGDPFDTDSWSQQFNESGVNLFNHMQIFMNTALDYFHTPGMSGFSNVGWTEIYDNGTPTSTEAVAHGTALVNLNFYLNFAGVKKTDQFMFTFQAYNGNTLRESADCYYRTPGKLDNQPGYPGWHIETGNTWGQVTPVPEPISMMMLGCLGAGMFVARKLRGKRAA